MISRIERAESSPTAALLVRLCAPLECSLGALFAVEDKAEAIARHADQPVWRDPETGYVRRAVSPPSTGSAIEIAEVIFPAGARITLEQTWRQPGVDQQIWLFSGELVLTIGDLVHHLQAGDCLHLWLDRPLTYFNPGAIPAHYSVIHLPKTGRSP
jgi:quercetin dioxygenase-like cupin family protein